MNKIEHVVLLMMENRSFDSLLGWLYEKGRPAKNVPARTPGNALTRDSRSSTCKTTRMLTPPEPLRSFRYRERRDSMCLISLREKTSRSGHAAFRP